MMKKILNKEMGAVIGGMTTANSHALQKLLQLTAPILKLFYSNKGNKVSNYDLVKRKVDWHAV